MSNLLSSELEELRSEFRRRQGRFEQVKQKLEDARTELMRAELDLEEEQQEVQDLQKTNLTNTIMKLTQKHSDRLERENEDVLRAQSKLAECQTTVEQLVEESRRLTSEIANLRITLDQHERAFEKKKQQLLQTKDHPLAKQDQALTEKQREIQKQLNEVKEAREAGRKVLRSLSLVASHLDSARKWATYDVWSGSGAITHVMKYERLGEAERAVYDVNLVLQKYQTELQDVADPGTLKLDIISTGQRVIDYAFDNIFTDLKTRETIIANERRVRTVRREVERVQQALLDMQNRLEREIQSLEAERESRLIQYIETQ